MHASSPASVAPPKNDAAFQQMFRRVMGRFATGVTVVTTNAGDRVHCMTANAFTAGSLEPPLCVVAISRHAQMHALLRVGSRFGVSFLSEWQQHLASHFAGKRLDGVAPAFIERVGTPILARAVAAVAAEVVATAECGDHTLFIGRLPHLEATLGRPLLFYGGRYARVDFANPIEEADPPEFW